jgi:hypothetical protein
LREGDFYAMAFTSNNTFIPWDPLRAMKGSACASCGSANAMSKCGACQFAKYCSEQCQRAHWADHAPACKGGYNGYIGQLEAQQKRVSTFVLASDDKGAAKCYTEAISAARAFGDAEGVRHNLRALAHRCEAIDGRKEEAAKHNAEAEALELIIGKASSTAKHVFSSIGELPSMSRPELPEQLAALPPRPTTGAKHAPPPRGAKSGKLPWCEWEQSIADVTVMVALPAGTRKGSLTIGFRRSGLSVALRGGVVIADVELGGRVQIDECTWTLVDDAVCITLEKAEKKVWDYLLSEPPTTTTTSNNNNSDNNAASGSAGAISPGPGAVDVSDAEAEARANQVASALSGLAIGEPDVEALMGAAIGADLAPPRPVAVATGPTEQVGSPPRTGTGTGTGTGPPSPNDPASPGMA